MLLAEAGQGGLQRSHIWQQPGLGCVVLAGGWAAGGFAASWGLSPCPIPAELQDEQRRLRKDLIPAFQCLKVACKKDEDRLFQHSLLRQDKG